MTLAKVEHHTAKYSLGTKTYFFSPVIFKLYIVVLTPSLLLKWQYIESSSCTSDILSKNMESLLMFCLNAHGIEKYRYKVTTFA